MNNRILLLSVFLVLIISKLNGQIVTTIAGTGTAGATGDGGPATAALLNGPRGLAIDANNNIYITDMHNQKVRKVNGVTGVISRIAGNGSTGFAGDGGLATSATLTNPFGLRMDLAGNLLIADLNNHVIRRVTTSTGIINTIAGTGGVSGYTGNGGPATSATFYNPMAVAVDAAGNYYISDNVNNVVRKVNTAGIVSIYAGQYGIPGYGYAGDGGPAALAMMQRPNGLAVDAAGNLYISDFENHVVRKVNTSGVITTVAGIGVAGYSGDGGPATSAKLKYPNAVCIDNAGNLFISEYGNNIIRKVNAAGIISTVAGTGVAGYSGDGGHAGYAMFDYPVELAMDTSGNLIVCDFDNQRVRKIGGVSITVSPNDTVCAGTPVIFTAHTLGNGPAPHFTWLKNGVAVSADSPTYSYIPANGDVVWCKMSYPSVPSLGEQESNHIMLTVMPLPVAAAITGTDSLCVGATVTLASVSSGGSWTSGSTGIATVSGGVVTGAAGGTCTISYSVTNSCGIAIATRLITVNTMPAVAPIVGPSTVCVGTIATLIDITPGGAWSASNSSAAVVGGVVAGITAGADTIYYTLTNYCGPTMMPKEISVIDVPVVALVTGSSSVCIGSIVTLSDVTPGGTWSASSGAVTIAGGVVTGVYAGIVTITYTVTNSCGSTSETMDVAVVSGGGCATQVVVDPGMGLAVYPNPSRGQFVVNCPAVGSITATDVYGRVVATQHADGTGYVPFDLSNYPEGVYVLRLSGDRVLYSFKVIVAK